VWVLALLIVVGTITMYTVKIRKLGFICLSPPHHPSCWAALLLPFQLSRTHPVGSSLGPLKGNIPSSKVRQSSPNPQLPHKHMALLSFLTSTITAQAQECKGFARYQMTSSPSLERCLVQREGQTCATPSTPGPSIVPFNSVPY
jgi:hypothetical protein